jgi:hypothetical protein
MIANGSCSTATRPETFVDRLWFTGYARNPVHVESRPMRTEVVAPE